MLSRMIGMGAVAAFFATAVHAQDTEFLIGVPDDSFSRFTPDRVEGLSITASQIDSLIANKTNTANALLAQYGLTPQISVFPANFTRDRINGLFDDLDSLEADIEESIRQALPQASEVRRVNFVNLGRDEVKIRVKHLGTAFEAGAGGFNASVSIEANSGIPVLCPTPDVSISVSGIAAKSTYDVFTGTLMDTMIDYRLTDADVDCANPFGDLLIAVASIFISVEDIFNDLIDDEVQDIEAMLDMQELFSIRDFFEGLRTALDRSAPAFVNEDKADMAIGAALEFLGSTNLATGLQVDVGIFDSDVVTTPNRITLSASHQTPDITSINQNGSQLVIFFDEPANTGTVRLYQNGGQQIASTAGAYFRIPAPPQGTRLQVAGESTLISGLRSFPSPYSSIYESPGPCLEGSRQC